jgi:hypothetical protein
MRSTTDHVQEGHDQTAPPRPMHGGLREPRTPRQRRRPPVKRSNDDLSVKDELDAAPTGGRLHPSMTRSGMRGMEDFTVEELAQLHQKLARWIGQRALQTERTRRRPWVMKAKTTHPADRRETP